MTRRIAATPLVLVLALVGCRTTSATPSPSEAAPSSPPASTSASTQPSTTASASSSPGPVQLPPTILAPSQVARVAVDSLPVFGSSPDGTSAQVDELHRGDLVYVTGWATIAEGRAWYAITYGFEAWPGRDQLEGLPYGSVQAGETGSDFLAAEPVSCPSGTATFEVVRAMEGWERWSCYGASEITLTALVDTPCCNPPDGYVHEPAWLADENPGYLTSLGEYRGIVVFHIDPATGLAAPERGQVVTMTGHFGDPASLTCTAVADVEGMGPPYPPEVVPLAPILSCQMEFVVSNYEVVGTESMPPCC